MRDTNLPPLDEFVDLHALSSELATTFPTADSIRWFVRRNRAGLVDSGALILVAGRMRFHPGRFKRAAVEIGQRAAA